MSTIRIGRLTAALLLIAVLALGAVALSACGSGDEDRRLELAVRRGRRPHHCHRRLRR